MKRILVIKLGALGDFVLAFGPFAAIRAAHPQARISLLTTAPFATLAQQSPWFDEVLVDTRPSWWDVRGWSRLRHALRGFDFVYDLQTSGRSSRYHLLAGRPPWSGIARGASHAHANPDRNRMHTIDRQRDQLAMAGIDVFPPLDLSWLTDAEPPIAIRSRVALLVPGAAPHRPAKRWPARYFGELAQKLVADGITCLIIGSGADSSLAAEIVGLCPAAQDLTGRTRIQDIASLAARAVCAVGNDTGPMHMAAMVGCPCVVLFSAESDPILTAPRGQVEILRAADLRHLSVEDVVAITDAMMS